MARIILQAAEVIRVTSVGQLVEIDDWLITSRQPIQHKVGADEAGATSHENHEYPYKFANAARITAGAILRE
jgi:hypothetical protein